MSVILVPHWESLVRCTECGLECEAAIRAAGMCQVEHRRLWGSDLYFVVCSNCGGRITISDELPLWARKRAEHLSERW